MSYNKFLAKIASDMNKPDGLYVITPEQGAKFVEQLPIAKFHGIGKVTSSKMQSLGIQTGKDLKKLSLAQLQHVQITRSRTLPYSVTSTSTTLAVLENLLSNTDIGNRNVRLLGVTLSSLENEPVLNRFQQMDLFSDF